MKENKKIMDEKIEKIGINAVETLNKRPFNKIVIGLFIKKYNETNIKNMEFYYIGLNNESVYFNELIYDDNYNNTVEEQRYLELQDLLYDLYDYCVECGDVWQNMTFIVDSNNKINVNFEYNFIEIAEWRNKNGLVNEK